VKEDQDNMDNVREYIDENGNKITVEVIETFRLPNLNKTFMAYTLNDDGLSSKVTVRFVEILDVESSTPHIKAVDDRDVEAVQTAFKTLLG